MSRRTLILAVVELFLLAACSSSPTGTTIDGIVIGDRIGCPGSLGCSSIPVATTGLDARLPQHAAIDSAILYGVKGTRDPNHDAVVVFVLADGSRHAEGLRCSARCRAVQTPGSGNE